MTDVVAFIDALTPRELEGLFEETYQDDMDAGTPRVTPRVMSSIYTGLDPAENGMMEVSKFGGEQTTRPRKSTFIDQAVRDGMSVVSMGMPFCVPFQGGNQQSILNGDALQGAEQTIPPQADQMVNVPPPMADMVGDHPDDVFVSFLDQTYAYFKRFKETIRQVDPDVAFVGYRLVDSYCHFQHLEQRTRSHTKGGAVAAPNRVHLIKAVQQLLTEIKNQIDGELMWFSDHGQTELTDVFRINRWLQEAGYLDYKVDYDFISTLEDYTGGETHPVNQRVENQFTFGRPGVTLNEENSQVVCADPFDSCLTLLCDREEFPVEQFREDLLGTGLYRSVDYKWELFDEDADFYENIPDIIPDRGEGVFVSGNLHKNPIGMGYYRSGVHDWRACFGSTVELSVPEGNGREGCILPEQMHDVITSFAGIEGGTAPWGRQQVQSFTIDELEAQSDIIEEQLN